MPDQKIMKDIGLNEPVAITLPAHIWLTAMSGYAGSEWVNSSVTLIMSKVQEELLDSIYLQEQLARQQKQQDEQDAMVRRMTTGQPPEWPPTLEDL